jgi:hypothetical protein
VQTSDLGQIVFKRLTQLQDVLKAFRAYFADPAMNRIPDLSLLLTREDGASRHPLSDGLNSARAVLTLQARD